MDQEGTVKYWVTGTLILFVLIVAQFGKRSTAIDVSRTPAAQARKNSVLAAPVFRAPASAATTITPSQPLKTQLKVLADLKACYDTHVCPFPETDPRSYEIALGKKIQSELANLRMRFGRNAGAAKDLQKTAGDFLQNGDGFVQEEALKILSDLPPSEESLNAITEGLKSSPDAALMEQALGEFQRYIGTAMEAQVHQFLSDTLATGAQFSSITVSEKIQPFLNVKSYTIYEKALNTMTPGAKAASNLSAALREYRRLQTGA
jgi:hypothetical protein